MKKHTLILIILFCTTKLWSQNWIGFSNTEHSVSELEILSSTSQSVSLKLTVPGIYKTDTLVNGTSYSRLILPGGEAVNPAGYPEIPTLRYQVAIPVCEEIDIEYQIISRQSMTSYKLYPVPDIIFGQDSDGHPVQTEVFYINNDAYSLPCSSFLEPFAEVVSAGALRSQRFAELLLHPVEYCPLTNQLSVIDRVEIILTFTNPQGDIRQNTGIFNKVAATTFINYEDNGISALVNDKAFEKDGFEQGNVQYINLTDTAQACQLVADYLIITDPAFFNPSDPNSQLTRLAEHRAFYNGFDVVILNVADILSDAVGFYYEGQDSIPSQSKYKKEQRIRTCIRCVYEGKNAQHTLDGHLAYVLLVGDVYENNTGMPTSFDHDIAVYNNPNDIMPSDYYYSCITKDEEGEYDDVGDLFIGRFSVENNEHLYNMVEKTFFRERDITNRAYIKNGSYINNYSLSSSYGYLLYNAEFGDFINSLRHINYWRFRYFDCLNTWTWSLPINESFLFSLWDSNFTQYFGKGGIDNWEYITQLDFSNELNNERNYTFINAYAPETGHFDNAECLGEFLTRYSPHKGAVGYIGASRFISTTITIPIYYPPYHSNIRYYFELMPYNLMANNISIVGELMLASKVAGSVNLNKKQNKYALNLFGDPALNLFAHGFEITRDATTDDIAEIPCKVRVHNNATLTILSNHSLNLLNGGKLIIENNGNLVIQSGAQINGVAGDSIPAIQVKGGGFIVGDNVAFNNVNGILLENTNSSSNPWLYDGDKQYNLRNVTFNNTKLTHRGTKLNISNCIFNNGSNVETFASVSVLDSCVFNETAFLSDYSAATINDTDFKPTATISNNNFTDNDSCPAILLKNLSMYDISNNLISGYKTGISLSGCGGNTLSESQNVRVSVIIRKNNISGCETGIELYNSVGDFRSNNIYENNFGIQLYNNCYTTFNNYLQNAQIIQDNSSFELYASANSFPVMFQYNQIVDEDNLGNDYYDPLIYWDVISPYLGNAQDINNNYWGENFDREEDLYPFKSFSCDLIWEPGKSSSSEPDLAAILYEAGLAYFAIEDYGNAGASFKELIEGYPESRFAVAALHELFALEQLTNKDYNNLYDYFSSISPSDSSLFSVADFLATRCNIKEKSWQLAIDWYEDRIENPPSYADSIFAVIDLGDIHLIMEIEEDTSGLKSNAIYNYRLAEIKPESIQAHKEKTEVLLAGLPKIEKTQTENYNKQNNSKGILSQNIPNPATGSTIINYEIFTEGNVEVRIYNTLGQLIKNSIQGKLNKGNYQTQISLSDISTGIYYYVLYINNEKADARKLVVNR
ncbi:MAG: C25 family cysteine peptidase [Bacteroidales bacterium]|jgi:hypothetical protein|nr:C25 family cysteine peptidase [Bacteroidales bacterium]